MGIPEDIEGPAIVVPRPRERKVGPFRLHHLIVFNVLVAAVLVGLVATRPLTGDTPVGTPSGSAGVVGGFYPLSLGAKGLEIGEAAPDFSGQDGGQSVDLRDLDGRPIRLADLRGRPVWIVFWASWCPPCQQETPDLRVVFEAHRGDGLTVIAIDIQEPPDAVRAYVEQYGLDYAVGLDPTGAIARTYGVFGIPTHYFVDPTGTIRDRSFGPLSRTEMERRLATIPRLPRRVDGPPRPVGPARVLTERGRPLLGQVPLESAASHIIDGSLVSHPPIVIIAFIPAA